MFCDLRRSCGDLTIALLSRPSEVHSGVRDHARCDSHDGPIRSRNDQRSIVAIGWHKPRTLFERYLAEQERGHRLAFVAEWRGEFAGYVTLLWVSDYPPFADRQVPEISDLNVLPALRRQGIGNALLDRAESAASTRSTVVGLGVGLSSDYGAAQRIYARRGYLPDGRGVMYNNQPVEPGATICIDDDATLRFTRLLRAPS